MEAKGTERLELEGEERHKVGPATETKPIAEEKGSRLRRAAACATVMCKALEAHHAISI